MIELMILWWVYALDVWPELWADEPSSVMLE